MGQGVHVPPGQGVGEQQFQNLMVRHALDPRLDEGVPEPPPMPLMLVHIRSSRLFRSRFTCSKGKPSSLRESPQVMPSINPVWGQGA